jgi:hypothetical protein
MVIEINIRVRIEEQKLRNLQHNFCLKIWQERFHTENSEAPGQGRNKHFVLKFEVDNIMIFTLYPVHCEIRLMCL